MKKSLLYAIIAFAAVSSANAASIASPYSAFTSWVGVIFAASVLGVSLAGIYYMIGYLTNNSRIRSSAISELEQAAGSILLVVIIIGVLYMVGTTEFGFQSFLGQQGSSSISGICNTYLNAPQSSQYSVDYLRSNLFVSSLTINGNPSPTNLPEPTTAVCEYLIGAPNNLGGSIDPITSKIDYGLAATYVIIANMTNQSLYELNALYNLDSVLFFLRNLNPDIGVCIPDTCIDPLSPDIATIALSYKPYQGYVFQRAVMPSMITQGTMTIYMQTLQLIFIIMVLMFWPYLLGAGIVLRTIPFSRRVGGFIIAATLVSVLILPTIFLLEYGSLSNLGAQSFSGASKIPGIALCGFGPVKGSNSNNVVWCYTSATKLDTSYIYKDTQPSGFPATISSCTSPSLGEYSSTSNPYTNAPKCFVQKQLSLYAYPNAADIINFYSCYPTDISGTIFPTELEIITSALVESAVLPITGLLSLFANNFNLQSNPIISGFFSPVLGSGNCISRLGPYNTVAVLSSLINMYGIITVSAFIIPILNFLMLISAMTGLSSLIGGETTIIGLSRFI